MFLRCYILIYTQYISRYSSGSILYEIALFECALFGLRSVWRTLDLACALFSVHSIWLALNLACNPFSVRSIWRVIHLAYALFGVHSNWRALFWRALYLACAPLDANFSKFFRSYSTILFMLHPLASSNQIRFVVTEKQIICFVIYHPKRCTKLEGLLAWH